MTILIRPEGQTADDLKLSRRAVGALGGLLFSGYAVAALAKEAKPITTDSAGLVTAEGGGGDFVVKGSSGTQLYEGGVVPLDSGLIG